MIGVLCDNSLLTGFALQRRPVDEAIVEEVCRDFDLLAAAEPANVNTAAGHPETARDEGPRPGEGKTPAATSAPTEPVRFGPIPIGHRRAVSRIADAFARAGRSLPEENSAEWDAERAAAEAHLNGTAQEAARPPSEGRVQSDLPVAPNRGAPS